MTTHTTMPLKAAGPNSHTWRQKTGNWNKHKQRRIPSSFRTPGRLARYIARNNVANVRHEPRICWVLRVDRQWRHVRAISQEAGPLYERRVKADPGGEDMGRNGWKAEGGAP